MRRLHEVGADRRLGDQFQGDTLLAWAIGRST